MSNSVTRLSFLLILLTALVHVSVAMNSHHTSKRTIRKIITNHRALSTLSPSAISSKAPSSIYGKGKGASTKSPSRSTKSPKMSTKSPKSSPKMPKASEKGVSKGSSKKSAQQGGAPVTSVLSSQFNGSITKSMAVGVCGTAVATALVFM